MKYYISTGYLDTREIVEVAKAADELGYDGLGIPDHVINLETLSTPYPYSHDGSRRWEPFTDWPDPWVLIGSLARCTRRLHFVTTVYVAALRDPYSAAKSIGTAALLADAACGTRTGSGLVRRGVRSAQREVRPTRPTNRRDDRADAGPLVAGLDAVRRQVLPDTAPGDEPTPPPIPIWVGGLSDIALRRAARHDGWISDLITTDDAIAVAQRLHRYRDEYQPGDRQFVVLAPLIDAFGAADYERAERGGVTHVLTMPWMFYTGRAATLTQKVDGLKRFRDDLGLDAPP